MDDNIEKIDIQTRVAFYLRVSTEEQKDKFGLDMQRQALDNYMKSRGQFEDGRDKMVLAGEDYIYIDDGISGTKDIDERREFARLVEDMASHNKPFDAVAVYKIDRLARKLIILLKIVNLFETNQIQFISVNETIDTSTPFGKAILNIMGVIAELEVETTKMRTQGGRKQSFKKGTVGYPNYGYIKNIHKQQEIFEPEAKIVRQIFSLFVFEDKNTRDIATLLKELKIESPEASALKNEKRKGKSIKINDVFFWRTDTVRYILSNEVYIGNLYGYKSKNSKMLPRSEWTLSEHHHPSIINTAIFKKAQERLQASAAKTALNRKRQDDTLYLLSGLLKCGYCSKQDGVEMYSWNGEKKEIGRGSRKYSYYYKCGHKNKQKYTNVCPTIPIPAEQIENYISAFVKSLLSNPKIAFDYQKELNSNKISVKLLKEERKQYQKKSDILPLRSKNILTQHEFGYITKDELEYKQRGIKNEISKCKTRLDEIDQILGRQELSKGYTNNFITYAKKYKDVVEGIYKDEIEAKKELYTLLHNLIDKIVVYTRPFNPKFDRIAGKRKPNQQIPNSILIKLKLPDALLSELTRLQLKRELEFVVKTPVL